MGSSAAEMDPGLWEQTCSRPHNRRKSPGSLSFFGISRLQVARGSGERGPEFCRSFIVSAWYLASAVLISQPHPNPFPVPKTHSTAKPCAPELGQARFDAIDAFLVHTWAWHLGVTWGFPRIQGSVCRSLSLQC